MFHILESLKIVSVLLWPFMPETAEKIQGFLGLSKSGKDLQLKDIREWGKMRSEKITTKVPHLFPRVEVKKEEEPKVMEKKENGQKKPMISFEEFMKLDLRIGTIKKAEAIPGSKKLIKLTVDIGEERILVAGIVGHYYEDELLEKQVVVVANLEPAKLMGVESHGMVLAAEDGSGVHLLVPDAVTTPGSIVK